ncbi:MAG: beta-N-acetylhexosaminidase [Mariniphaga sp.]|nr:beta-N-acetylhexosaminidase [Mariniphaga sp.]
MNQFIKRLILVGLIFQFVIGCNVKTQKDISIIPKPVSQKQKRGEFTLGQNTKIIAESGVLEMSANFLQNYINEKYGIQVAVAKKAPDKNFIQLYLTDTIENKEGYVLKVRDNVVEIIGKTGAGVFYGIQTFMQMLPSLAKQQKQIKVQAADIEDFPQFGWRGQHLDVARHFFSLDFIKNMLEVMAIHKLNTFHWHLTEDQGWRMEIKKYPKLTQIGAWRDSTLEGYITQYPRKYNRVKYGGFYTQEEIKEIVQYAKERNIRVIPEIEMPGHSLAALAAYPEVSCTGGPFNVATEWGVFEDVYCAGKEKTFEFLENILDEVIQLFPNEYIHIGGDEVLKTRWESCEDCQRRIHEESLKNEDELQSYFIKRIEKYLHNKGKKLIGWDEIIEGGLPERATVMSWRGMDGGIKSAKSHHHTIMAPWSPCYFYLYQGKYEEPIAADDYVPLSAVYNFHPVPDELS